MSEGRLARAELGSWPVECRSRMLRRRSRQNGENIILHRHFKRRGPGTYVDVGQGHEPLSKTANTTAAFTR